MNLGGRLEEATPFEADCTAFGERSSKWSLSDLWGMNELTEAILNHVIYLLDCKFIVNFNVFIAGYER